MKTLLPILVAIALVPAVAQGRPDADPMSAPLTDFTYQGQLRTAIQKIAQAAKVAIEVDWNSLAASDAKFDAVVKVAGKNVTPGQLLDSALAQAAAPKSPLAWQVKDGVVRVSTQKRVLDGGAGGNYVSIAPEKSATPSGVAKPVKSDKKEPTTAEVAAMPARELNFENSPLGDVLEMCRRMAGVNMHVNWKALQAVNIDKSTPVSLNAGDITIGKAVDLIFEQLNTGKDKMGSIYWVIDGGVMVVSTGEALNTEMRTRTFDVTDLLMVVPNFAAPQVDLANAAGNNNSSNTSGVNGATGSGSIFGTNTNTGGTNNPSGTAEDADMAKMRQQVKDTLVGALQDSIGKDMWEPQGKGSIKLLGKQLIITQSLLGWKLMEKSASK